MYAVEFRTKIKNGIIEIPEEYRKQLKDTVRVIVLADEKIETTTDIIEELIDSPIRLPNFVPMKRDEIYDRKL
jgi:hypothetical protein